jgi:hypothetical protein
MVISYYCRHCSAKLGAIENNSFHSEQLGLHKLTDEERQEMVTYGQDGNIYIKAICEDCHEALSRNPDLHQYDYLIH